MTLEKQRAHRDVMLAAGAFEAALFQVTAGKLHAGWKNIAVDLHKAELLPSGQPFYASKLSRLFAVREAMVQE